MKSERHNKIIEIINTREVDTQEMLAGILRDEGFKVTQATVSRDIRELNLIKTPGVNVRSKYAIVQTAANKLSGNGLGVFKDVVLSMEKAENILVIKTEPGMAMAAAAAIDAMNIEEIAGSIAGDDTIMCAIKSSSLVDEVIMKLNQ
ncbi:MAG: arginine repressor [Lachnospiraceae bacterium]|nr:arginine repressor [Lachnospiraceae bacterium]